jgi:type II secretory pathway pseudopilin PulG
VLEKFARLKLMIDTRGQLLLEVLVALTILGVVAVAVVNVSTQSLKGARVVGDRQEALGLAEETLTGLEKERDEDLVNFFTKLDGSEDCGPMGENNEYDCTINYNFDSPPDSYSVEVNVVIEWPDGGGSRSVELSRVFTKVRL